MNRKPLRVILLAAFLIAAPLLPALAQDTDGDLMPNSYETAFGCLMPNTVDAAIDYDSDSMTSLEEYTYSLLLDPCDPDTDRDGLPDGWEDQNSTCGFDPISYSSEIITFDKVGSDLRITTDASWSYSPSLLWTGSEFGICWYDFRNDDDGGCDSVTDCNGEIYFARVSEDGAKIGSDQRVTNDSAGSHSPSLSWTGSEYGVSWDDWRDANSEIYFARIAVDGTKVGSDQRVTSNGALSFAPSLVWTGSEYGVSWEDKRDGNWEVYFARISQSGAKIGHDVRVSNSRGNSGSISLAWTGSEFGVSWDDDSERTYYSEIYFSRISAEGVKIGSDLRVTYNSMDSLLSSLSWTGSEYGVSWQDSREGNWEIYFARISAAGDKIGSERRVTSASGVSYYPSLSWTGSEFGVAWEDTRTGEDGIYFARISAEGSKVGSDLWLTGLSGTLSAPDPFLSWTGSEFGLSWVDGVDLTSEIYFTRIVPVYADKDGDGLRDPDEFAFGTDPCDPDTDGDLSNDAADCNPFNPAIHPGAIEIICDHIDQDCDGLADSEPSLDGDPISFCDGDCDDADPVRFPGNIEITCDHIDQDCDGLADDDPNADGDPFSLCAGDCEDTDPTRYPGAVEIPCDGIDQDCDGLGDDDQNADGDSVSLCAGDCDDNDPTIHPGATEILHDDIDQDCDGLWDDDPPAGKQNKGGGGGCGCMVAPLAPASASLPAAGLYALPLAFALGLRKATGKRKRRVESRE